MKVANAPSAPLHPEQSAEPASVFRLQKISEIEAFLRTEVENREHCNISDDEYKLVPEQIEKFCTMKEEIRRKHLSAAGSMINDETKNALIEEEPRREPPS